MEDLKLENLAVAELVSAALLGATVGALCGQFANSLGRRRALLTTALLFLAAPLLSATAPNYGLLLFGRTLTGIPIGVSSVLTNLYITEVSPAVCRGRLGGWAPFIGTSGILVSYLVSAVLQTFPNAAWRFQIGLGAVPALAQLFLSGNLPETPRWLLSQSRKGEAKESLRQLFRKALIRYIDKLGRRPLAATGIVGMLVGLMLIVVGSLLRGAGALLSVTAWFALSSMLIYRAAFSLSLGPLPYVMTSEFFAQEARAAGVGFCWAMNWLSNFGVSLCFKVLVKALPGPYGQAIIFGT
ncbi:unnamed protein product [Durusdinium trenchii]|uniref:Major facilitator superfamily (MFS) profile domain-containing protein n=1 Tax=Durusdinium trenchii TaxID=1381693 RepID=A0ABP0KID4_9DINO